MTGEPKVDVRAEQPYVSIPNKTTLKEWGRANALVGEVFGWLAQGGIPPAGPLFYRYWVVGDADRAFDLEVGCRLPARSPGTGG